jgi:beta-lactamase regulating signal transducer with metallopeptidase domain
MMIAWWIAQIALLGALLALAAWGAESALRAAGKPTRWAWMGALVATLALAALAPMRAVTETVSSTPLLVTSVSVTGAAAAAPTGVLVALAEVWNGVTTLASRTVRDGWSIWHASVPASTERMLLMAWIVASVALLALFITVHLRFQRRRAQWPLGTVHGTTVRIADDTGPAVIGVTSAEIVVPRWLLTRDAREQQLVLAHELEHVQNHDPLLLVLAQAAVVLLPWHPAVWWMASRLRLAVELDCDRRVLQRGASARDYGTLLIDLTDHRTGFGAALPAFSCTPSHLERRLLAMTPKPLRYPLVRALSTGALASLALLAACEAKLPTDAEVSGMTAASATRAVGKVTMMDTTKMTYSVNGVGVSSSAANAIAPESIANINVTKTAAGTGEVRIVTRNASTGTVLEAAGFVRTPLAAVAPLQRMKVEVARGSAPEGASETMSVTTRTLTGTTAQRSFAGATRDSTGRVVEGNTFAGLMVLDGVITDAELINRISPDRIVSVNVIKGPAATAKYSDPRATNGVIEITTKKAKP